MNKIATLNTAFKISRAFDIINTITTIGAIMTTIYVACSFLRTNK